MARRDTEAVQSEIRIHRLDGGGQWGNGRGQSPSAYNFGTPAAGPFLNNSLHDPIYSVGRAEQHSRSNAVFGPPADGALRWSQFCGWEFRCATSQLVRRSAEPRHDDAADEATVGGDAVEGGRSAEIHDHGINLIEGDRGQGVDDPIGADGERLIDVEANGQRGRRVNQDRLSPGSRAYPGDEALRHSGGDR